MKEVVDVVEGMVDMGLGSAVQFLQEEQRSFFIYFSTRKKVGNKKVLVCLSENFPLSTLKSECSKEGLPVTGSRIVLMARIRKHYDKIHKDDASGAKKSTGKRKTVARKAKAKTKTTKAKTKAKVKKS